MRKGETTLEGNPNRKSTEDDAKADVLALVLVWAPTEGDRLGEVVLPRSGGIFGRGPTEGTANVGFVRQKPGMTVPAAEIANPFLSREHLRFTVSEDAIEVETLGRRALRVGDAEMRKLTVREGDLFEIDGLYAFYCARRPPVLPPSQAAPPKTFGHADDSGIVGESPAAWALRSQIAFFAKRNAHVLVTGASGTGKELIAQAIHRMSSRARKEIVSRNAATFPSGLIDAELFGNVQNYPNAGMPERPGLIGQADGGTLFLDEIGELPTDLQAHFLRVLDAGEYQKLGESRKRVADFRLVAATNRAVEELKEDLAARLALRVHSPGLDERREDVTLLARHLLLRTAAKDPQVGETFFADWDGKRGEPRLSGALAAALVQHAYATHVRELEALLYRAASTSKGDTLELTDEVRRMVRIAPKPTRDLTADEIRAALARHNGVKDKAWRDLRLPSRHALHRLMKKLNVPD